MSEAEENEKKVVLSLDDQVMAQGEGEIDIDVLTVKILILCDQKAKMDGVGTFLNRRGWETSVTIKLEQAIKVLASDKPDFVMISMNHTNKKVSKLPQFIQQTFNTRVIVFGERADSKTIGLIHAAKTPHKVMGMVSGPSVHRKIKQILNEIYNKKSETSSAAKASDDQEGGVKTISGGSKASDHPSVQRFSRDSNGIKSKSDRRQESSYYAKGDSVNNMAGSDGYFPDQSKQASGSTVYNEGNSMSSGESFEDMNSGMGLFSGDTEGSGRVDGDEESLEKQGVFFQKGQKLKQNQGKTKDHKTEDADGFLKEAEECENSGFGSSGPTSEKAKSVHARGGRSPEGNDSSGEENDEDRSSPNKGDSASGEDGFDEEDLSEDIFDDEMDGFGLFSPTEPSGSSTKVSEANSKEKENNSSNSELEEAQAALGEDYSGPEESKPNEDQKESPHKGVEYLEAHKDKKGNSEQLDAKSTDEVSGDLENLSAKADEESAVGKSELLRDEDGPLRKSEYIEKESFSNLDKEKTFFLEAVENALGDITRKEIGVQPDLYFKNIQAGIIPLQSNEFNGYLLLTSNSREFDLLKFSEEFLEKFDKEIHKNDVTVHFSEAFVLDLKEPVDVYEFSKVELDFVVVEHYPQEEVQITYLECSKPLPEVFQKIGHIKSQVKVEDIPADYPLEFSSFLHLKKNKKYFLFIRENNKLLSKQKDRLIERKVDVYINRDDVENFKKTFAKSEVAEVLENFLKSKTLKAVG